MGPGGPICSAGSIEPEVSSIGLGTQAISTKELFADIDRMDAPAFASYFAEDGLLHFGNADEVRGRGAIEATIAGFFGTIKGLRHRILERWDVGDTTILQAEVTYTRTDDGQVTLPAVVIFRRADDLIEDYRIYIDQAPLYS
jgi:ketosteroid isomerase-like protein